MIQSVETVIGLLKTFPGIGEKSARRMAYHLLKQDHGQLDRFAQAFQMLSIIHPCPTCGRFTDNERCDICTSSAREHTKLCIVEDFYDAEAIEATAIFNGIYHILGGRISPSEGIFAKDLSIDKLLRRISDENISEVIIATNPTLEGEATAHYLTEQLRPKHIAVSRLAIGLPIGGELGVLNPMTIKNSFQNRHTVQ